MNKLIYEEYLRWYNNAKIDIDIKNELKEIKGNENLIYDAFFQNLKFGTGGLRGIMGAGINRINIYTVAKASQGVANYIINNFNMDDRVVAISYDSRIKSTLFGQVASLIFARNGIKVFIFKELMPTPCLSYAIRNLTCIAGIMITASHNSSEYNGYKVYDHNGCQITTDIATKIQDEIDKVDIFYDDVLAAFYNQCSLVIPQTKKSNNDQDVIYDLFNEQINTGMINYISDTLISNYVHDLMNQSVLYGDKIDKNLSIVYSPLNGTGLKPVLQTFKEAGYKEVIVVEEQRNPDGNFSTCPLPNPEIKETMEMGLKYASKYNADLFFATDPDCDRVGLAVRNSIGEYTLLTGNEIGILLFDYICSQKLKHGKMPKNPILFKTIVTTDLVERIAEFYNVEVKNVLTGFKYIGEQIGLLEKNNSLDDYVFGFEESNGYLSGSYVRDKDAVGAIFLICEMFSFYKSLGVSLLDKLDELYKSYGYNLNTQHSVEFKGQIGLIKMENLMETLQKGISVIGDKSVIRTVNYNSGIDNLPKSNVLKFILDDDCSIIIRPSGTEPKLKVYVSVLADSMKEARSIERKLFNGLEDYIENQFSS